MNVAVQIGRDARRKERLHVPRFGAPNGAGLRRHALRGDLHARRNDEVHIGREAEAGLHLGEVELVFTLDRRELAHERKGPVAHIGRVGAEVGERDRVLPFLLEEDLGVDRDDVPARRLADGCGPRFNDASAVRVVVVVEARFRARRGRGGREDLAFEVGELLDEVIRVKHVHDREARRKRSVALAFAKAHGPRLHALDGDRCVALFSHVGDLAERSATREHVAAAQPDGAIELGAREGSLEKEALALGARALLVVSARAHTLAEHAVPHHLGVEGVHDTAEAVGGEGFVLGPREAAAATRAWRELGAVHLHVTGPRVQARIVLALDVLVPALQRLEGARPGEAPPVHLRALAGGGVLVGRRLGLGHGYHLRGAFFARSMSASSSSSRAAIWASYHAAVFRSIAGVRRSGTYWAHASMRLGK